MKSKKGFTLVELLAVIAILAILVIIALPNILNLYRNARENVFVTEVQEIIKSSQQGYLNGALSNKDCMCFSSASNPLEIDARNNLEYYVEFNNNGEVINLTVKDKNYQFVSENEVINVSDIGSSRSGKEKRTQPVQESTEVPSCDSSSGSEIVVEPKNSSMLKESSIAERGDSFFSTIDANKIESMVFTNTNKVPDGVLGSEDVSEDESGNIMMWWTDSNGNGLYEATVGQEGGVRNNTSSGCTFHDMWNLKSLDLTYFYTADSTNMAAMFNYCSSLTELDLSSFDTSQVTNMYGMFDGCSSLQKLDLSNFDTSKVENMSFMFSHCSNLQTIKFGEKFNTSSVTYMSGMFQYCSSLTDLDLSNFTINEDADLSCMFEETNEALDIKSTGLPNYESLQEGLVCSY